jgi:hypothetical protein
MYVAPPVPLPGADVDAIVARELLRKTDLSDTHPALAERLAAIGAIACVPADASPSAAQKYLGSAGETLARELDEAWRARNAKAWRERHEQYHRDLGLLTSLNEKATREPLNENDEWQRLLALERLKGKAVAQPEYERFLAARPMHAGVQFAVARLRLEDDDESGLDILRKLISVEGGAVKPAAEVAYRYLKAHGRNSEAAEFEERWRQRQRIEAEANRERTYFSTRDTYLPAPLPAGTLQSIKDTLSRHLVIGSAYLVQKKVKHFPENPAYLLYIVPRAFSFGNTAQLVRAAIGEIQVDVSLQTLIHVRRLSKLRRRIGTVPGAKLYSRSWF